MGFRLFNKRNSPTKKETLYLPVSGRIIPLEETGDPVFAKKMMGEGFAVEPSDGTIVFPVTGTISLVADTGHAFGLQTSEGLEILVHLGIDTVTLKGQPFSLSLKTGEKVIGGRKAGAMDLKAIQQAGKAATVIIAVTNSADQLESIDIDQSQTEAGEAMGSLIAK
ncbi:MAG: PTS glucose transporter subunit IIA [Sporolactobacillus sp.]